MSESDTIAALATHPGRAAIAIVRVSGRDALAIAQRICNATELTARRAHFGGFYAPSKQLIDRGLVLYFQAPCSYTGEDVVEFQTHGSMPIIGVLLEAIFHHGARAARPGEFTARAFLNGKLDLVQAEAVADLINAATPQAAVAAGAALNGIFSQHIGMLRQRLIDLRVQLEAQLDFGDEELGVLPIAKLDMEFAELRDLLAEMLATARRGEVLNRGIDAVIAGPPNVGKSTLLNRLAARDIAIVTPVPGTTRDVLSLDLDIEGLLLRMHDTAGLHDSTDPIEREGMRRARMRIENADLVLLLQDASDKVPRLQIDEFRNADAQLIVIENKIDLTAHAPGVTHGEGFSRVRLSAMTGAGVDQLKHEIIRCSGLHHVADVPYLARARHLAALEKAGEVLGRDQCNIFSVAPELAAERLRLAHHYLDELTGIYTSEDLLGDIFASFCLGK